MGCNAHAHAHFVHGTAVMVKLRTDAGIPHAIANGDDLIIVKVKSGKLSVFEPSDSAAEICNLKTEPSDKRVADGSRGRVSCLQTLLSCGGVGMCSMDFGSIGIIPIHRDFANCSRSSTWQQPAP